MTRAHTLLWSVAAVFYLAFCGWYTNLSGPLTGEEIEHYADLLAKHGATGERIAQMRRFMAADTGRQLIMVNVIDMARDPPPVEGAAPGDSADALLDRYMQFMWPALLRRACHPVFAGNAVFEALDIVGIDGAQQWSRAALMRYRSRRDVLDIATNPAFRGRHEFKMAALEKTIAFPVETQIYLSDLRFLVGLGLLSIVALVDIAIYGRRRDRAGS
jgi:hypothetical protein